MAPALALDGHHTLQLRGYQQEAIEASEAAEARGCRRQLWVLPTGTGKTVTFVALAAKRGDRVLIIAHRDELISQAAGKARLWWPDADIGIVKGARNDVGAQDIVVASVQSLSPARMARIGRFGLVIVDECFPAGTMVGDKRIEDVRVGDLVPSYDESTGEVVERVVLGTTSRAAPEMLRLVFDDGTDLVCTTGHPLMTSEGWEIAGGLSHGASVLSFAHHGATGRDNLHGVWATDDVDGRSQGADVEEDGPGLLLRCMPDGEDVSPEFGQDGGDQSQARLGSDAGAQPDAPAGVGGEDACDVAAHWAQAVGAGREWQAVVEAADRPRQRSDVANGVDRENGEAAPAGSPDALQGGHRQPGDEGRRGSGRSIPWLAGPPRSRPSQGRVPQWKRVARVEVLEPGSDGRYAGRCPDGLVYNLHVAGTNTYLVDDGVVAHNCHHSASASYTRVLETLRAGEVDGPLLVGVTATPGRADGKGLSQHFTEIVVQRDILWAIRSGYLVDIRCKEVKLTKLRLENVAVTRGDYADGQLGAAMAEAQAPWHIVKAWKELAPDRLTASFHPTIEAAKSQAAEFMAQGVRAACVSGVDLEDRRRALADLSTGRLQVVTNAMVLTEGWDFPALSCIVMARPTKSSGLYTQVIGRGLRPYPGKDDCLVIDVVGASEKVDLCSVPSLFGVEKKAMRRGITATEAVEEKAAEKPKPAPGPRMTGDVVTRDVDLFRQHGAKPGKVSWGKTRAGAFAASAGKMSVVMEPSSMAAGAWCVATISEKGERTVLMDGVPLGLATSIAEDHVRANAPASLVDRARAWRKDKPTDKQLAFAQKLGIGVPATASKGDVSAMVDARLAEIRAAKARKAKRRPLRPRLPAPSADRLRSPRT
jgi:superfamily II DNA or RNA helicase